MHFKWIPSALDLLARWIPKCMMVCGVCMVCATHLTYMLVCLFLQSWLWWSKSWIFLSSLSWDLQPLLQSLWVLGQRHLHGPDQPHLLVHPQQPGVVQVFLKGLLAWSLLRGSYLMSSSQELSTNRCFASEWIVYYISVNITACMPAHLCVSCGKVAAELSVCVCVCMSEHKATQSLTCCGCHINPSGRPPGLF